MAEITPFLPIPHPREFRQCACGEPLVMEMEHDANQCVECLARAAQLEQQPLEVAPAKLARLQISAATGSGKTFAAFHQVLAPRRPVLFLSDRCGRA